MRILTKYLLRAHLGPFFFSLSVLTGLLLINTVARRFEELAGKGLPLSVITEVFVLSIPYTLALTFPMSVLVAVLYVFSQLMADNEITALKASGVSLIRLLTPLILIAVMMTGGMIWFNDTILPESNHRLRNLLIDIGRKSPTLELREQVVNEIRAGERSSRYYLQAARIEPATNHLYDVVIYDLSDSGRDRTIYADSGQMAFNAARTDLFLTLYDGWVHERERREPDRFTRMFYDEQVIRMAGVGNVLQRDSTNSYRGDREMSVAMLAEEIRTRRDELATLREQTRDYMVTAVENALLGPFAQEDPDAPEAVNGDGAGVAVELEEGDGDGDEDGSRPAQSRATGAERESPAPAPAGAARRGPAPSTGLLSLDPSFESADGRDLMTMRLTREMESLGTRARTLQQGINRYEVELHKKFAIPFACIVFVLIGAPLAVRFPGGGVGMVIAFSLLIFSIYWMGLTGGEQLGDRGHVSPVVGMWMVNVIFLALGLVSLARFGREASTARGGAWDDFKDKVRDAFARRVESLRRRRAY